MYLKSLEISGFKSFAKKAILEFNAPITAIVGPNGSGKSNVAEAFRFVLGEQSIKSLRGKRGEDLIYNGGKSQNRLNRASVKVIFDNTSRALKLDFDEVRIERVVHRDSANEYFINDTAVRLKDIVELLADAHIGSSGHHIISQGEADRILNSSIKERREIIEEALGLKVYHYKREESLRKLDKTEENLKEARSLRKEIAPHIRFLEKQVEKIEKAREMRMHLQDLAREYFKREFAYIAFQKSYIEAAKKDPEIKINQLELELQEARTILSRSDAKDAKSDELLALEHDLHSIRFKKSELIRHSGKQEGEIAASERNIRKQIELLNSADTKTVMLKDVEHTAESVYRKIAEAELIEDSSALKSILSSIRALIVDFISHNKTETNSLVLDDAQKELVSLKASREETQNNLEIVQSEEIRLEAAYAALQTDIEKEKDTSRDAEKAVFRIMAELQNANLSLQHIKNQEESIVRLDALARHELHETAMLVGRSVLDYAVYTIKNAEGFEITEQSILEEDRTFQEERKKTIERIKIRLEDAGAGAGEEVLKEYEETKQRDEFLAREIDDLEKSAVILQQLIKDLEEKLTLEFKAGVEKINTQFQQFFALMFGGGSAELTVVREEKRRRRLDEESEDQAVFASSENSDDASASQEGIDINISLPQKRIKGLMMLSGGERALTSIALLFAISQVNPPPFIILDETDAALDEANSRKYGDMVDNLSKLSQLIVITHNRETMSHASVLYGVTMSSEGFSKLLSIKFEEAVAVAK